MIKRFLTILLAFALTSCSVQEESSPGALRKEADRGRQLYNRLALEDIEPIARDADSKLVDGWVCGRDPRVFKSPYRVQSPRDKAQFALAYRDFLDEHPQELAASRKTYIPYKMRSAFARKYWERLPAFVAESEKYQVAWIHESLLDGSELLFRALEKKFGGALNSALIMSHDVEQNMVSKYMEDESTESSFAWQLKGKGGKSK